MPEQIKIGCKFYQVLEVENVNKFEPRRGEIDYFNRHIRIDRDMPSQDKIETLLHEVIHGIDEFMGIGLDEEHVRKLGDGLAMVFQDNPQLMHYE